MKKTELVVVLALVLLMTSFSSASLQAYYRFDSNSMDTPDYSVSSQDISLIGGSLRFDGVDDYVTVNHSGRLNLSIDNGYAISTWFKVRKFSQAHFRLGSMGHNDYGRASGFNPAYDSFMNINGYQVCDNCARGFTVAELNSSWGLVGYREFDTHGGDGFGGNTCYAAGNMTQYLQSQPEGTKMIMVTDDQPQPAANCGNATVLENWEEALKDYGADGKTVFNLSEYDSSTDYRASYMLIGRKGAGNDNAQYYNFMPRYGTALYMKSGQIVRIGRQAGLRVYKGKIQGFTDRVTSETSIETGWHHAVIQFTSDNRSQLWVDGRKVGDKSVSVSDNLIYGAENDLVVGGPLFHGSVDQVSVYDTDLSGSDIKELAHQERIGPDPVSSWEMKAEVKKIIDSSSSLTGEWNSGSTAAAWSMDVGTGSTIYDLTENNISGSLINATWVDGVSGSALNFSGDGYASLGKINQLADNQKITVSAWVYPRRSVDDWQAFFGDSWQKYLLGIPRNSKRISFDVRNSTGGQVNAVDYNIPEWNRWYHVVAVADAEKDFIKIYINGTLETSKQADFALKNQTGQAYLGSLSDNGNTDRFYGRIDEVTISTTAWDISEVKQAFQSPEAEAVEKYNYTSANSTGHQGIFLSGSYDLDGADDYLQIDRKLPGDQTVSAWIKTEDGSGNNHWETKAIAHQENRGPANDWGFGINGDGKLVYGNGNGLEDFTLTSDRVVADGRWHHVAFTREKSSGMVKLYIDGSLDSSAYLSKTYLDDADRSGGGTQIGRAGDNSPAKYTNMVIDEFRMYNNTLSEQEIQRLTFLR